MATKRVGLNSTRGRRRLVAEDARDAAGGDERRAVRVAVVLVDVADRVRVDRASAGSPRSPRGSCAIVAPPSLTLVSVERGVDQPRRHQLGGALRLGRAVGGRRRPPRRRSASAASTRWPCGGVAQQDPADADLDVVGVRADRQHRPRCPAARRSRVTAISARAFSTSAGGIERLGQVVVGAGAHRGDRVVERAVAREDQRGELRPLALDALHELESVDPGQVDVGDDQVPVAAADDLERLLGARGPVDVAEAARAAPRAAFRRPRRPRRGGCVRRRGPPSRRSQSSLKSRFDAIMALVAVLFAARRRSHWGSRSAGALDLRLARVDRRPRGGCAATSTAPARSSTACRSCSARTARSRPPTTSRAAILRGPLRSGNQAWVGLAALEWRAATCSARHERLLAGLARWLLAQREELTASVRGGPDVSWVSTEHNLEARALFARRCGRQPTWSRRLDRRDRRSTLFAGDHFRQGLGDDARPLDVQALRDPLAARARPSRRRGGGRARDRRDDVRRRPPRPLAGGGGQTFSGYRPFADAWGPDVLWMEGTLMMRLAKARLGRDVGALDDSADRWAALTAPDSAAAGRSRRRRGLPRVAGGARRVAGAQPERLALLSPGRRTWLTQPSA